MEQIMQAIAQTLRNCGVEATAGRDHVTCNGCAFYAVKRLRRKSFCFCGRYYLTGNVRQAVIDLLLEMPARIRMRDEALKHRANKAAAEELNKKLDGKMKVTYDCTEGFSLEVKCDTITEIQDVATRIAAEMEAAWEATWNDLLNQKSDTTVRFTAEGGFSLN